MVHRGRNENVAFRGTFNVLYRTYFWSLCSPGEISYIDALRLSKDVSFESRPCRQMRVETIAG